MASLNAPQPGQIEVSLFGPGFGECVVIHAGDNQWIIIDSCWDGPERRPIGIAYLQKIGVDPSTDVKVVAVTHWHMDHYRGAASTLEMCTSAVFACSAALMTREYLTLIGLARASSPLDDRSGVSEFASILDVLHKRQKLGESQAASPDLLANEGGLLFQNQARGVELRALSPSANTISSASATFAKLIPSSNTPVRRFSDVSPNDVSVAMALTTPTLSVLLGADLENSSDARRGWSAVLNSKVTPRMNACGFKVAHHGSPNADHPGVWGQLLDQDVIALLTPYARGQSPLPANADVLRLKGVAKEVFSTAHPPALAASNKDPVDKTMREITRSRKLIRSIPGHVRIRMSINGSGKDRKVDLFDGAKRL